MRNPLKAPTIAAALMATEGRSVPDEEFFSYLRLPNGTFKTTQARRMEDVNDRVAALLRAGSPPQGEYQILDAATSSGTAAVEFSDSLSRAGVPHRMRASDQTALVRRLRSGPFDILATPDGHLLQADLGPLAFPNTPPSRLSGLVLGAARRRWDRAIQSGQQPEPIPLLSRVARKSRIRFSNGDVWGELFEEQPGERFDVIRVANLLQPAYFPEDRLRLAVANVRRFLRPGGLLVLVRSSESMNRYGLFRLDENRFRLLEESPEPLEIRDLVLNLEPEA